MTTNETNETAETKVRDAERVADARACESHGLPRCGVCGAKARAARKARRETDDTLATVDVVLALGSGLLALEPVDTRRGVSRALRMLGVDATGSSVTFPADLLVDTFGSTAPPTVATFIVGGVTKTGRARKGATRVDVALDVLSDDGGASIGRHGSVDVTIDGRPYVATVRVRVTGSDAWYTSASLRPGALPKASAKGAKGAKGKGKVALPIVATGAKARA